MEVTKKKREELCWECRNGLTPPRSDHFLLRQTNRNHRKYFCRFVASFGFGESADNELLLWPGFDL
jgi:hypothetical protein